MSSSRPYSRFPSESRSLPPWKRIPTHLLAPSVSSHIRLYSSRSSPFANTTTSSTPPDVATPKLTHLTPSGTAHMVAISHKSPTTRLATAVCTLQFSNPTALPLIRSNNMKKGDVLSVARIAGIMAAKRTADLVPLCHPIAITHVSVELEVVGQDSTAQVINSEQEEEKDVERKKERVSVPWQGTGQGDAYPFHVVSPKAVEHQTKATVKASKSAEPPGSFNDNTTAKGKEKSFGSIKISATVQCDGKTGVEMEALTAASVAALTVYDMCKAVDKGMRIEGLRVVRKEGGKSGTWVEGESVE
ncbi:hypothetical protein IFR04_010752 [Cadophora malorum]|uniref:cyclic pyranopterin monophosphate synthase n=1 Tax=Cadophora malorum TaxID=108018 RepID=A0A8H7TA14_9HELO|nr:hypothetical protein IFR04_010752 [Cadophora malorum]